MTTDTSPSWLLLIPKVPAEPSRHRVAVWRELRRIGAVPAASGAWTVPDLPAFTEALPTVRELAQRGGGGVSVLKAASHGDDDVAVLRDAFIAARVDEWEEFIADCGKFSDEIDREIAKEKFTFGELEEEEQSLDRLRRWHRDLRRRNIVELDIADAANRRLDEVTEKLAGYAEQVFARNVPDSSQD
ncbi:Chromate resistance protein ChrB [Microbacterium sp. M3]|uniref:Chromate resistance protein ChrB n=1 Tax=Microbacterium arthrosphaerae TaxID=792652 RepID=A0ABU4H118_9MICO|nr:MULTISPECIES: Chromate resistance protein ChrB [Microbacterium]MDW4572955.1 Chromate resistance protein ChrB [Microbacterium arthrosphaerae]MDW7606810.1 Chromate resistance protein ChrB [Microbacterium sp. M3]